MLNMGSLTPNSPSSLSGSSFTMTPRPPQLPLNFSGPMTLVTPASTTFGRGAWAFMDDMAFGLGSRSATTASSPSTVHVVSPHGNIHTPPSQPVRAANPGEEGTSNLAEISRTATETAVDQADVEPLAPRKLRRLSLDDVSMSSSGQLQRSLALVRPSHVRALSPVDTLPRVRNQPLSFDSPRARGGDGDEGGSEVKKPRTVTFRPGDDEHAGSPPLSMRDGQHQTSQGRHHPQHAKQSRFAVGNVSRAERHGVPASYDPPMSRYQVACDAEIHLETSESTHVSYPTLTLAACLSYVFGASRHTIVTDRRLSNCCANFALQRISVYELQSKTTHNCGCV
jgi:hypothetical protein